MYRALRVLLIPVCLAWPLPAQEPKDPSAEEILAKHIQARGGEAKLRDLSSVRITGTHELFGSGEPLPLVVEQRRPNLRRLELKVRGMTEVSVFDGKQGWTKTPWAPEKDAQPMKPETVAALLQTDFDTPYLDWKARGWKLEFLGIFHKETRVVYQVRLVQSPTDELIGTFDVKTFEEVDRELRHRDLGEEWRYKSTFGEYQAVGGVTFPFLMEHRALHKGYRLKITVDKIELNPPLADGRFAKP